MGWEKGEKGERRGFTERPLPALLPQHTRGLLLSSVEDGFGAWRAADTFRGHLPGHTGPVSVDRYFLCS